MNQDSPKVSLITGVRSGFGRAYSDTALAAGHQVIGTVRRDEHQTPRPWLPDARIPWYTT